MILVNSYAFEINDAENTLIMDLDHRGSNYWTGESDIALRNYDIENWTSS